jgi:rare lipoprotein A (peptidoglycan hydrolase)
MKAAGLALFFVFLTPLLGFGQVQRGDASYNPDKEGLTIDHATLSLNARVKITNLENHRSVEAVVNGRIPDGSDRIADISREAGDILGMSGSGMSPVEIEVLDILTETVPAPPSPEEAPAPENAAASPPQAQTRTRAVFPTPFPLPEAPAHATDSGADGDAGERVSAGESSTGTPVRVRELDWAEP